jgi:hypothetical protein
MRPHTQLNLNVKGLRRDHGLRADLGTVVTFRAAGKNI